MPEITRCSQCQRQLRVPDHLIGQMVKCPSCGTTFTATVEPSPPPPPPKAPSDAFTASAGPPPWPSKQQQFPQAPRNAGAAYPRRDCEPHRGAMILTFGILALVLCGPIFGPLAWIMGNNDLAEIRAGRMDRDGEGLTQAGRICGIIGSILGLIGLTFFMLYFCCLFALVGAGAGGAGNF